MLKNIFSNRVSKNIFALSLLQLSNYIVPLLALPLLSRGMAVDQFGNYMVIISIWLITQMITDFGFSISAPYKISQDREFKDKISTLLGNIFTIKIMLSAISIISVLLYTHTIDENLIKSQIILYIILGNIILQAFHCNWFFQGIEKMKYITIISVSSKFVFLFLLFLSFSLLNKIELYIALGSFTLSQLIIAIFSIFSIYKEGFYISKPQKFLRELKYSFSFFVSRIAVTSYTSLNVILINLVSGNQTAGIYSAAEKLYQAGNNVPSILSGALYPYTARTKNIKLLFRITLSTYILFILGILFIGYFSEDIILLVFGKNFISSVPLLNLFLGLMCITFLSIMIGYPGFAAINKLQLANYTVILGSLFHICGIAVLYYQNNITAENMIILVMITESIILLSRLYFLYKHLPAKI